MKKDLSNSRLVKLLLTVYRAGRKTSVYLSDKRLKWQRRSFYKSLGLFPRICLTHNISPFLKTGELDATIYAYTGEMEKLKRCLERKVSPDLKGLMENAIFAGNVQVVKLLLDHGANPNRTVELNRNTVLHAATQGGKADIVELLLANGADPNRKSTQGKKPLFYAYDRGEGRSRLVQLLEPVTEFDRRAYDVDNFLKMEDQVAAYYAFREAIEEGFRHRSPAELRVLSLPNFLSLCCANGFLDMYWQATWACIPSAELMEAISEPALAERLRKCIAIVREYGQIVGRDPFDSNGDYLDLDEASEEKLRSPELDFCKDYGDWIRWDDFCRKTMEYVRRNRELFT